MKWFYFDSLIMALYVSFLKMINSIVSYLQLQGKILCTAYHFTGFT